jgi:threonine/homoserine/homoserine lactone efflux protein
MFEEYERRKRKQVSFMRSLLDYGMGVLILGAGIFFFFRSKFNSSFNERFPPNDIDKIFGAICIIYGAWRIYRGYKKNYFK